MHNETFIVEHVNFEKLRLIGDRLLHIKRLQTVPYNFDWDPEVQSFLSNIKVLAEEKLWEYSKRAETAKSPLQYS